MTNNKIIDALKETNKWWKGSLVLEYKDREIYGEVKRFMKTKQILAFTGLRRVGKTTLMLKIVKEAIDSGFDPENIVFFSFDDFRNIEIKEVLEVYKELMGKEFDKEKYLFLFDEIQKIDGWEEQIKRVYDNHKNFKIVVSGSESLFIRKKTRESLAGRFFEFKIQQLTFKEYLDFKDVHIKNMGLYKEELFREFKSYIWCNGFPETINEDKEIIKKYIRENIIEKVIYRDIPQIFPVKDVTILESIFNIIFFDPGQIINLQDLSKDLGISRQTLSTYLDYLEKSFLIKKIYNFSKNIRKTERKMKKYYPSIISSSLIEKEEWGKVLETIVVLQSGADFFWRDVYKNEVDIVMVKDNKIIPIEIKSGNTFDIRSLFLFMGKFKVKNGFVVSLDQDRIIKKEEKTVQIIPSYKFLFKLQINT